VTPGARLVKLKLAQKPVPCAAASMVFGTGVVCTGRGGVRD
jgi:hypothetical protein